MPYIKNSGLFSAVQTAVALGNFDGLHLGHMAVIGAAAEQKKQGLTPVVLKFREHPARFLGSGEPPVLLSREMEEKRLGQMGVRVCYYDFPQVRALSAWQFVEDILIGELHAAFVSCGYNYRFGKNAGGDARELESLCRERGVQTQICSQVCFDGEPVSSTAIRKALAGGDMHKANGMLGYRYSYDFTVVTGDRRGRLLGAPTINQFFPEGMLVPRFGVYASRVLAEGVSYAAVTNIGLRPTIGGSLPRSETYIEGYSGDLYGKNPTVSLIAYMRPEIRFDSLEQLSRQIAADAARAAEIAGVDE